MPRSSKKQKLVDDSVRKLLFVPFDDPFGYVRADRKVLDEFDCRTAKMIKHTPPVRYHEGMPVWEVDYKRSVLIELIKCLTMHEFVVSKDVTYAECVSMLRREGIGCPGAEEIQTPKLKQSLLHPMSQPVASYHTGEPEAEQVVHTCTLVANAIAEWPRPRIMLSDNVAGRDSGHSSSASRFWIKFAKQPFVEKYGGDELYHLAKNRPKWLERTLKAIGFAHCELVRDRVVEKLARDPVAFTALADHIKQKEVTRYYISVKRDMPKHHRDMEHNEEVLSEADTWAAWVLSTVVHHGSARDMVQLSPTDQRRARRGGGDAATRYARAAVALAEDQMKHTPNCYRMFNGECSDDDKKGNTPERIVLAKALKQRGVKVVRWRDDSSVEKPAQTEGACVTPILFPPSFFSSLQQDGPCVLLELDLSGGKVA